MILTKGQRIGVNSTLAKCDYPKWVLDKAVKPKHKKAPFRLYISTTDIDWRSQKPAPSLSRHGASIGVSGFPMIKITVICQVRMYCGLSVKANKRERLHGTQTLWTHFVCVCSCVCGWQKPEYPQMTRFTKRAPPCSCVCQLHSSRQNH